MIHPASPFHAVTALLLAMWVVSRARASGPSIGDVARAQAATPLVYPAAPCGHDTYASSLARWGTVATGSSAAPPGVCTVAGFGAWSWCLTTSHSGTATQAVKNPAASGTFKSESGHLLPLPKPTLCHCSSVPARRLFTIEPRLCYQLRAVLPITLDHAYRRVRARFIRAPADRSIVPVWPNK